MGSMDDEEGFDLGGGKSPFLVNLFSALYYNTIGAFINPFIKATSEFANSEQSFGSALRNSITEEPTIRAYRAVGSFSKAVHKILEIPKAIKETEIFGAGVYLAGAIYYSALTLYQTGLASINGIASIASVVPGMVFGTMKRSNGASSETHQQQDTETKEENSQVHIVNSKSPRYEKSASQDPPGPSNRSHVNKLEQRNSIGKRGVHK